MPDFFVRPQSEHMKVMNQWELGQKHEIVVENKLCPFVLELVFDDQDFVLNLREGQK